MKKVDYSTKAKKDLKRYRSKPHELAELFKVLKMLAREQKLPAIYHPHQLQGEYEGCMECHVKSDFLLIWIDEDLSTIRVLRVGSHSELFR
ncbi:type II toxin-antitoxin system YafQ family toxin [[Hallella] seregens]|uniref:Type II toxin-antitoxin system YafQ family toxin n=1 Tax=Hallella seregens ATCC 51272 TaxID=1336250 RepID=A0ABV5ZJI3_9BACT|nr:type II toxin-antitoxin system YafQ family toxin [Hallella seregens]